LASADLSNLEVASRSNMRCNLGETELHGTDLSGADLHNVFLRKSILSNTDLSGADLRHADLSGAWLQDALLQGADLRGTDLRHADLSNAKGMSNKKLEQQADSLEGATMPDGQKYEDWLKSKNAGGKDGESGGPS
jgi:uncharacterized protein YjbI with pentapeptide repeats